MLFPLVLKTKFVCGSCLSGREIGIDEDGFVDSFVIGTSEESGIFYVVI